MTEIRRFVGADDPRLDCFSEHDPDSENFDVRDVLPAPTNDKAHIPPRLWDRGPALDQGNNHGVAAYAWTGELIASPFPAPALRHTADAFAQVLYRDSQVLDGVEGPHEGTSVLGVAKAIQARGYMESYYWAFDIESLRDAVVNEGPAVVCLPFYDSMATPKESGLVEIDGSIIGGAALLLTGYHPEMRIAGEDWNARYEVFRFRNCWGDTYGDRGDCLIHASDLRDLLQFGEACIPWGRSRVDISGQFIPDVVQNRRRNDRGMGPQGNS